MAYPEIDTVLSWRGRTIVDENGEKIGKFEEIYLDTETERPEWAAVKVGLFRRSHLLIPLTEAQEHDDETLRVPFAKSHVENAPDVDVGGELSQEEEARLYEHYGLEYSRERSETGLPRGDTPEGRAEAPRADTDQTRAERGAPTTDEARAATARGGTEQTEPAAGERADVRRGGARPSEVEVDSIDVEQRPRERVRLKKYVVTEEVTKKVPLQREEVRVEREPVEGEDSPR